MIFDNLSLWYARPTACMSQNLGQDNKTCNLISLFVTNGTESLQPHDTSCLNCQITHEHRGQCWKCKI